MTYDVIRTGSQGNAVVVDGKILIDCGISFQALGEVIDALKLVLLTHIHGDHFKRSTIRRLGAERPTLRFACGEWMVEPLNECGINPRNIDVMQVDTWYDYGAIRVSPVPLSHDVPNCGWRVKIGGEKLFYATDTGTLAGISAKDYDLYMIECNYEDEEIRQRIMDKQSAGEYAYEIRAREQHLSKAQCDAFIYDNIGAEGQYVYLHMHKER